LCAFTQQQWPSWPHQQWSADDAIIGSVIAGYLLLRRGISVLASFAQ
jgi:hypothetical protein